MNTMKNQYPLLQSQQGIYAECMQFPDSAVYDNPFLFKIGADIDLQRLKEAIQKAVKVHPYVNCRVKAGEDGVPVQYVVEDAEPEISITEVADIEAVKYHLRKPFRLDGSPLTRFVLIAAANSKYMFMQFHHIIWDGGSLTAFLADLDAAYQGKSLEPELVSTLDCAETEARLRKTDQYEADRNWYREHLVDTETETMLFPDYQETDIKYHRIEVALQTPVAAISDFCKQNGVRPSNYFCSAFALLMSRYTGEEQVLFPTIWNGRVSKEMARTIGMFVTTVPLYYTVKSTDTVADLLEQGRVLGEGTRYHALYSYSDAVSELGIHPHMMFIYQGRTLENMILCGAPVAYEVLMDHATNMPVSLQLFQKDTGYLLRVEYQANRYAEATIRQLVESFDTLIGQLTDMQRTLGEISITSEAQLHLLDSFNLTDNPYDTTQTIVALFRKQAKLTLDSMAVIYHDRQYTYREVDEISDRLAGYILSKGLQTEDVVSILIPRCEWMPIAAMGVLKAGCAYQPLDPSYPAERLNFMVKDANAKLLIADEALRILVDEYEGEVLLTKDIMTCGPLVPITVEPHPENLFILLYTSGSTGVPKGCQLTHANLMAFCHWYRSRFELKAEHHVSCYASYGFDCCMMDLYPALTCGACVYIIGEDIRLNLPDVNDYFEANHITHSFMTTQVGYQFVSNIENHSLLHLVTAGEKLASVTPPKNYHLHNGYGPTEGTILITEYEVDKEEKDIPIGKPLYNSRLYVVDKQFNRLPQGALGELWISGPHVTRGYLNRPEKTAEVYIDNPFDTDPQHSRVYRTGDIVRYLPDGNLQFVGRRDGQVKIRGFRIELKEVEAMIRKYPSIKDCTVQAFDESGGGKFIAAYIVSDEQVDIQALNQFILEEKPPYMVPAVTMQIDQIPLNQNQKVNRKALPKPEKPAGNSVVEENVPMNVLEKEIHAIIAEVVNNEDFGVTTPLVYIGLTSIMAIRLAIQINKRFGIMLDSKSLVKNGTLQSIENEVLSAMVLSPREAAVQTEIKHSELTNIPLSYAQMGVYVDCMKQPTSTIYNIPSKVTFPKDISTALLKQSLQTLVKAHPILSVHFDSEGSDIVQILDPEQPVEVLQSSMTEERFHAHLEEFVQPFNLKRGPLYRFEIVTTEAQIYLLADIHHLVIDGGSLDVFLHQLFDLMDGKQIEAETFTYADFVEDEKAAEKGEEYQAARDFFQQRLGTCEGVTDLPADLTNPKEQGRTSEVYCPLDFAAMEQFCKQHHLTPAHLSLASVFYTLSRFTNQEKICICTISNGRSDLRIRSTVGMFVNTLAMSAEVKEQKVMDFLQETSQNFDETLTHEKYPFAQIAADYDLSAEILFAYQIGVFDQYVCQGQAIEVENLELDIPKFRVSFFIKEYEGKPAVCVEYDDGRYSRGMMQSLAQAVCNVINAFMHEPEGDLLQVSLINETQTQLLDSFNQTDEPFDTTQTVVSLFREQVKRRPDKLAVVFHEKRYTYLEVDEITDRLAGYIIGKGLKAEDVVSILIPRCEWMPLAALGVLKAGCAYQPLDPSYPSERLNFMVKDANAKLLIADEALCILVDEYEGDVLLTKDILTCASQLPVMVEPKPEDLFNLLYTSGSTGVPKGCQLEHRNVVAFCHMNWKAQHLTADSCIGAYASFGFDASVMELFSALTLGAELHIIPEEIRLDLAALNDYITQNGLTHIFMTTQVAYQFATNFENQNLKVLLAGGEKLSALNPPSTYTMANGYGPSETICYVTYYEVKEREENIPIGKAQQNFKCYVVDKMGNRLPVGASGELWVAGPQVTRGYLNRPEKTAESFIDNPFDTEEKYARVYRTGDIVRYLPDGNLQYVGRRDGQVKIRGFRIELKEVEAVIRQFPGIKDATVQSFEYESGGKYIAAYIVSDQQINVKELNTFIGKQKPPYMIPASTIQIEAIPLTQNQKVNRKALPTPIISAGDHAYVAPEGELEELFCKIFADILLMDKIGADDNFFELGGTSLMVTRVMIEADKNQHHIAYGDLFAHPTPRQLAAFISGDSETNQGADDATYNYTAINEVLSRNTLNSFLKGERLQIGNVLLTGATGYLGIHILRDLIERDDVPVIWCLVRAANVEKAEHRLRGLLFYYFGQSFKELFGTRLRIVLGDVTEDIVVEGKVDTVFNCAAIVKHFSSGTEIEDVNIGGAEHCVKFCLQTGAKLVHVSTYSTAGMSVEGVPAPDTVFTEQMLYFGQYLDNQYIHSKFISERIVLEAIAKQHLNAKIVRLGNLAPRSTDGEFQINFQTNSAMGRIRVFKMLGCYPYELTDEPLEFSPINEVAHSIVLLSETPRECVVFHAYNNHPVFFGDVLQELSKIGEAPRQVEAPHFVEILEEAKQDPEKAKRLSSMLAYQDMAHGQKSNFIAPSNAYTTQVLYRLGFRWSATSWDYVDRFLTAIDGMGYFD
ncbi:MAG: amino acid adenylation domain-containing protein [Bacteroidaceae bacterium]|nr:amino acid adenylation domain-containing protein [Bacteroidaceae bacterium]